LGDSGIIRKSAAAAGAAFDGAMLARREKAILAFASLKMKL
jgi:hypothetical protein